MNWYKVATEGRAVPITSEGFGAMTRKEKRALARNGNITLATQLLFFTEEYGNKSQVLENLAWNTSIHPETQRLFFTEDYVDKHEALRHLAFNPGITQETQRLFFTEKYKYKDWVLQDLARNESIAPETQRLFFTEKYEGKDEDIYGVLENLVQNPSFLRGEFTPGQWHSIKNAARGVMRLLVLSKRLEQIAGVP